MILRQLLHRDRAGAVSYVVGCAGKGIGAVVDPVDDVALYRDCCREEGLALRYVVDTHVHADHVSGAVELCRATGARYLLGPGSGSAQQHRVLEDGELLELGNVALQVLHTPGHTPEHVSLSCIDRTRAEEPWCVLTGHTLLVGDMGRTELAGHAEDGAQQLFASAERLRRLSDDVLVLPGAFSGSACGRGLSGNPVSSVGFERRHNRAFSLPDRARFLAHMLASPAPELPQAAAIRARNLGLTA